MNLHDEQKTKEIMSVNKILSYYDIEYDRI